MYRLFREVNPSRIVGYLKDLGGDKIPRKGGPGVTQSDLLIINKTDLAEAVGASLEVMKRDSKLMRQNGPTLFTQAKHDLGVDEVAQHILAARKLQMEPGSSLYSE
ncbi:urease accessory protein ureg-like [Plakobranchus ocellatus]|uniref:Urease accessory protein ureg-like n=1 Tax=Plakobranchus ocellatus TaxID=259542 RepID=A0AAV4A261_9GAST|nr:urease accessory protein ureg-like [Plakobranchus ocellatus]